MNWRWYAYGKVIGGGLCRLTVLHTFVIENPLPNIDKLGNLLAVFDHEPTEDEKDRLLAQLEQFIIEEEPV